jgi:hypothetical protein
MWSPSRRPAGEWAPSWCSFCRFAAPGCSASPRRPRPRGRATTASSRFATARECSTGPGGRPERRGRVHRSAGPDYVQLAVDPGWPRSGSTPSSRRPGPWRSKSARRRRGALRARPGRPWPRWGISSPRAASTCRSRPRTASTASGTLNLSRDTHTEDRLVSLTTRPEASGRPCAMLVTVVVRGCVRRARWPAAPGPPAGREGQGAIGIRPR